MKEEFVSFTNEGEKIVGVLHIPRKIPAPAIIFCHGGFGNRIGDHRFFVSPARELCEKGFVVLRFDFRGCGESEGDTESLTISREVSDLGKAIDWLQNREEVLKDRLGVFGHSLGGVVAILTSASDERVKAVCTMSSPADFKELMRSIRDTIKDTYGEEIENLIERAMREGHVEAFGERIGIDFFHELLSCDVLGGVGKIAPRPLLIIHGTEDHFVPPSQARKLFEHANEPKEIFLVEGGNHSFQRKNTRSIAFQRAINWLCEKLG